MVTASQLEELRFLKAIFADEILIRDVHLSQLIDTEDYDVKASTHQNISSSSATATNTSNSAVSFQLNLGLQPTPSSSQHHPPLILQCTLPPDHPNVQPTLHALPGSLPNATLEDLNQTLLERLSKSESIYDVAMFAKQWVEERLAQAGDSSGDGASEGKDTRLSRRFFWTHHTRRKQLLLYKWAKELKISGRLTVSKPGYIFVEGAMEDVKEFTRRNMAEKWKEIRMTWEEDVVVEDEEKIDACRVFPDGLREVSITQFINDLRERDRADVLQIGTRGAVLM